MTAAPHAALQLSNSKFPTKQGCQDSLWRAHELPEEGLSTHRLVRHLHTANWQACVWTGVCQWDVVCSKLHAKSCCGNKLFCLFLFSSSKGHRAAPSKTQCSWAKDEFPVSVVQLTVLIGLRWAGVDKLFTLEAQARISSNPFWRTMALKVSAQWAWTASLTGPWEWLGKSL